MRAQLSEIISSALNDLLAAGELPTAAYPAVEIIETRGPEHGDFSTNFAMASAKAARMAPRAIAEKLAERLSKNEAIEKAEVAGPGFLNLFLRSDWTARHLNAVCASEGRSVLKDADHYAHGSAERPEGINVEFVSVNPNGPITIGSGRGAAYGSTLCNVLQAAGHRVHREYYINDGVNSEQMRLFAESVKAIALNKDVPERGYKGDYVHEVAKQIVPSLLFSGQQAAARRIVEEVIPGMILHYYAKKYSFSGFENIKYVQMLCHTLLRMGVSTSFIKAGLDAFLGRLTKVCLFYANEHGIKWTGSELTRTQMLFCIGLTNYSINMEEADRPRIISPQYYVYGRYKHQKEAFTKLSLSLRKQINTETVAPDHTLSYIGWNILEELSKETDLKQIKSRLSRKSIEKVREAAQELMISKQREDLFTFKTKFNTWFSEQVLHDTHQVEADIQKLIDKGLADEEPHRTKIVFGKGGEIKEVVREEQPQDEDDAAGTGKTLWLRSTKLGDDMDRVLRRKDGRLTYISSDISYHRDKLNRPKGADKMITILGPDHHGYIGRLQAVVAANIMQPTASAEGELTEEESLIWDSAAEKAACQAALTQAKQTLEVQIFQLVRFLKDGKPAPMRKRDGNIYALIDLVNEIGEKVKPNGTVEEKQTAGKDVARFFYLMRHHNTTFDFDLDLAEKQSDENPVFYVQYAHARICSVIEKAAGEGLKAGDSWKPEMLQHAHEKALMLKILDLRHEIERCSEDYGVNRLATYAIELARTYHHFYDACRVIQADKQLSLARLALCVAARTALQSVLEILGVSAPQRMEHSEAS